MAGKRTVIALLARGVSSKLAERLVEQNYTLSSLMQTNTDVLKKIGLSDAQISAIQAERPPIPEKIIIQLMHESRSICNVCRGEKSKSIVVHHIEDWAETRSHSIDNLILLCLCCHDEAHTTHENSRNLTPKMLRELKQTWLDKVKDDDQRQLACRDSSNPFAISTFWDYLNHTRIIDIVGAMNEDYSSFFEKNQSQRFLYGGSHRTSTPYYEFVEQLASIIQHYPYHIIDNRTPIGDIKYLIDQGSLVLLTGNHRFKKSYCGYYKIGPGQNRKGYYKRGKVKFEFTFDGWETTSSSSYGNLSGNWICTSFLLIRSITKSGSTFTYHATCLGIGTNIFPHHSNPLRLDITKREGYESLEEFEQGEA